MNAQPPGLNDPAYASFAWGRFRRLLRWSAVVAALAAGLAVYGVSRVYGPLNGIAVAALSGGVFVTILLAGALMGLAFLSSGSGHDEAVRDFDPVE